MRFICSPCGFQSSSPLSPGGMRPKYATSKFSQLAQHYKEYHPDKDFIFKYIKRVTCHVCELKFSLKNFREHIISQHSNFLAPLISVNICMLCNAHYNYREQMLEHLLKTHSKKDADNFDTNVTSQVLCLFCGAKSNFGETSIANHQCSHLSDVDITPFIDLTAEINSPPGNISFLSLDCSLF